MKVSYNAPAIIANNYLNLNDRKAASALERLSSGWKINRTKDNAAGLAIAKRMSNQLGNISSATNNSKNGVSVISTIDGVLSEVHDMLQRLSELSIKAANGTWTDNDRKLIDEEVQQLTEEIERSTRAAQFNSQKLLDGTFAQRGYLTDTNTTPPIKTQGAEVMYVSDAMSKGSYQINITVSFDADGNIDKTQPFSVTDSSTSPQIPIASPAKYEINGSLVTIKSDNYFEITLKLDDPALKPPGFMMSGNDVVVEIPDFGGMRLQIGPNEGQVLLMNIPNVSLEFLGIDNILTYSGMDKTPAPTNPNNLSDVELGIENANKANDAVKYAISQLSKVRAHCGAYQNRLEHIVSSLDISNNALTESYSLIMDTDMSTEMTEYTKLQIMTQAAISMVAQANERPQQVLQLLR